MDHLHATSTQMGPADQAQYWKTQAQLSVITATTPSYANCCEALGWDPRWPSPYTVPASQQAHLLRLQAQKAGAFIGEDTADPDGTTDKSNWVLILSAWQVMGLRWAQLQEAGPVGGGIITDDCGTGKTIQQLALVLLSAREQQRQYTLGTNRGPFKPTIVICPSHVVDVWFTECRTWFPELDVWRYFETKNRVQNPTMKSKTLDAKPETLNAWLTDNYPSDEPRSAACLIITGYETLAFRALRKLVSHDQNGNPHTGKHAD